MGERRPGDDGLLELLHAYVRTKNQPGSPEAAEHDAAFDVVAVGLRGDPERAWRLLELACHADLTEDDLFFLAAGPLEQLLSDHADLILGRLDAFARAEESMRIMISGVWRGRMTPEVWARFEELRTRLGIVAR